MITGVKIIGMHHIQSPNVRGRFHFKLAENNAQECSASAAMFDLSQNTVNRGQNNIT